MSARRILVTGASKGIGRAICERLHADGYEVIGAARTRPADWPSGIALHAVDLADAVATDHWLHDIADQAFHGLVNNVGMVPIAELEQVEMTDLHRAVQLNIETALRVTQRLAPSLKAAGDARIVNIASRAALGKHGRTVYSMTKAGLIGMTRTWALEFAPYGATVNAIAPGPIATEFFVGANDPDDPRTQALLASIPLGRLGEPAEVAHAAAYFLDVRCGFVTGQTHFVCGGMSIGAA